MRRSKVGRLSTTAPAPAIAAIITARASGHCEILAPACTYHQTAMFRRRRGPATPNFLTAADLIAACDNCIDLVEHTEVPTALDLGYIVDPRSCCSAVPLLWRQYRWVYLDPGGQLHPHARTDSSGTG
ncbi:hypothetical protein [Mycobacterium sp. TY815]|uniref:hypothetical protein n=1 Tax=Mycobacterium sp. TY815 TaxID=3050581 RepID=UPI0027407FEC|nr:hypothetical protein [Mycobacterium sp. TY815]MDP7707399.1 hypothetical protein [Mycobacterium sp. TY815]